VASLRTFSAYSSRCIGFIPTSSVRSSPSRDCGDFRRANRLDDSRAPVYQFATNPPCPCNASPELQRPSQRSWPASSNSTTTIGLTGEGYPTATKPQKSARIGFLVGTSPSRSESAARSVSAKRCTCRMAFSARMIASSNASSPNVCADVLRQLLQFVIPRHHGPSSIGRGCS